MARQELRLQELLLVGRPQSPQGNLHLVQEVLREVVRMEEHLAELVQLHSRKQLHSQVAQHAQHPRRLL